VGKRVSLVAILALTVAALAATFAAGNSPLLGLDLQGGVSVVLQPTNDVDSDTLDQSIEIIRRRVDGLGVAEPEVTRQGSTILVQLPGVDNQQRAVELVGQTAELRFRPVLQELPPVDVELPDITDLTVPPDDATPTTAGSPTASTITDGPAEQGLAPPPVAGESAAVAQAQAPTTEAPPTTAPPLDTDALDPSLLAPDVELPDNLTDEGITPRDEDDPDAVVVLPQRDDDGTITSRFVLGPQLLTGSALEGAEAVTDQTGTQWQVNPTFKGGADGIDRFNEAAQECNNPASTVCPAQGGGVGRLAIVLDAEVIAAPAIQQPSFERDQITITGDFDESEAKDLALVLRFGALPVELERQDTRTVSATLGEDSLRAGIVAGLIGLGVVAVFMIAFYRLLGMIAVLSLLVSGGILWSMISYLGASQGLALTLAGVTGLIVSIGVSLDSNIVYFEHLKEDVRRGRTLRSSADRSFSSAFSTIVKADIASLIGAGVLYWLTIGPVRGFALYLGLATLIDLVASYFFMRPAVILTVQSRRLRDRPRAFGLPAESRDESPDESRELVTP
jgi:preprotein translocase subunit SecD